jgi:putative oxidoreductase
MATTINSGRLRASSGPRGINITIWTLRVLLGAMFIMSGSSKLTGAPEMVGLFNAIRLGEWLRYFTGAIELAAGAALFVPRLFGLGAAALMGVMLGAAITHVLVLDSSPAMPLVLLLGLGAVIWLHRARISGTFMQAILPSRS